MHREPDVGLDPGSPGSRPGPKTGAKPLRHPGIPHPVHFRPRRYETRGRQYEKNWTDQKFVEIMIILLENEWSNQEIKEEI